jgi:DNA repair protein RadC
MDYDNRLSIKKWAEEDKPREKFASQGRRSLSNAELLAIILGSGSPQETAVDLAKRILQSVDNNLNSLGKLSLNDLQQFKGVGEAKAISIAAAMELGRRRKAEEQDQKATVKSSADAYELIAGHLLDLEQEEFWVILLDRANQVIQKIPISSGGVSGTLADAKLIFKPALEKLASSLILCHNHPSGQLKASQADLNLTKKLSQAAEYLDIKILDHIIVGNNSYLSLADEGLI